MPVDHTVKSFDEDLRRLSSLVSVMGGLAEVQVEAAVDAVARRDTTLAGRVVQDDTRLDDHERQIEGEALRLLALRQPLGSDLREVLAALKIATDLERTGDYAANIAKRAMTLAQLPLVRPVAAIPRMGRLVRSMLKEVLDAYVDKDVDKAVATWHRDEELDDLYTSLFREVLTYMMEDPRNITPCTHVLFMAKNMERIGDHATNIAETVHFLVEGRAIGKSRPKHDETSFTMFPADGGDVP